MCPPEALGEPGRPYEVDLALDEHVNVPTVLLMRLPRFYELCATAIAVLEHGRPVKNPTYLAEIDEGARKRARAEAKRDRAIAAQRALLQQIGGSRRKQRSARYRSEQEKLEALLNAPLDEGARFEVELEHGKRIKLNAHALSRPYAGLAQSARVNVIYWTLGKLTLILHVNATLRRVLSGLEPIQQLPHLFRGGTASCVAALALSKRHHEEHDLRVGALYYARRDAQGALQHSSLLKRALGYHARDAGAGKTLEQRMILLKNTYLSGAYASHAFEANQDDRLLKLNPAAYVEACALPEGVRAGHWHTITFNPKLIEMNFSAFVQVPTSLLLDHDLHTVNAALHVLALKALNPACRTRETQEAALPLQTSRFITQSAPAAAFSGHTAEQREALCATRPGSARSDRAVQRRRRLVEHRSNR